MRAAGSGAGIASGFALALVVGLAGSADANRSGIPGRAQIGCGGSGCHSGGDTPTVELLGPASLEPGGVADFVVRVSGAQMAAGANVESTGGLLVPGDGLSARAGQLVHAGDALGYTDGAAEFTFRFEAPEAPGTVELFAAGNSVNNNFQASGDGWGLAATTITIGSGVAPDGGISEPDAGGDGGGGSGDDSGCQQRPGAPSPSAPLAGLLLIGGCVMLRRSQRAG